MKIWDVCEVHESRRYAIKQPPNRCDFVMLHGNWKSDPFCVFVPMRLIPDNGETADREALVEALDRIELWTQGQEKHMNPWALAALMNAGRERLAQLPETCGTCKGTGGPVVIHHHKGSIQYQDCPTCHVAAFDGETP